MPYASENQISQSPIEGGIEITQAQYAEALAGMMEGKIVTIDGGFAVINPPEPEQPEIPDPSPQYQTQFSVLDFRDRFTIEEQLAIRAAQLVDMEVGLVYDAFISAQFIDVTDPRVEQGIDLYVAKELLEPDRKAALLETVLIPPPAA